MAASASTTWRSGLRPVAALGGIAARYRILLRQCWRAHRGLTVASLLLAVVAGALPVATAVLTGVLVGRLPAAYGAGLHSAAGQHVLWAFGGFVLVLIVSSVRVHAGEPIANALTTHYVALVQDVVAGAALGPEHIGHMEDPGTAARFGAIREALREGGLLNGVTSMIYVAGAKLSAIGGAIVLLTIRWWTPFVLLVGLIAFDMTINRWLKTIFDELVETTGTKRRRAEYVRTLMSSPAAAKEIRVFGLSGYLGDRFAATWRDAMGEVWRHRRSLLGPICLSTALMLGCFALVFGELGYDAYLGSVSLRDLAIAITAAGVLRSIAAGGDPRTNLARATVLAAHIDEIERAYPAAPRRTAAVDADGPAAVELRDVTFTYPSRGTPTLRRLSLDIPAGQSVAIVGVNGAGKSTLIKLLTGLYPADRGTVRIGGVDVSGGDPSAARRVAVIFQDFVRYPVTLRENVGFGHLAALGDDAATIRALTGAGGAAVLDRVGGDLGTTLSAEYDGGTDLSGGQWQRVALARALAALDGGAGVLILDEPTAALDVRAEAELFDRFLDVTRDQTDATSPVAVRLAREARPDARSGARSIVGRRDFPSTTSSVARLAREARPDARSGARSIVGRRGATTILVSHRLSSVRHADRIVVIEDGAVIEDGSHDALIAAGGRYAGMFALQAARFRETGDPDARGADDA